MASFQDKLMAYHEAIRYAADCKAIYKSFCKHGKKAAQPAYDDWQEAIEAMNQAGNAMREAMA